MIELRQYRNTDANQIVNWIKNERELRLWGADRYDKYPLLATDINKNYDKCKNEGGFYPMTLVENEKVIGHLILRNPIIDNKNIVRLGFIIIDNELRGKGYGKKLINKAIEYAKKELNAKEINLGVYDNNTSAFKCYQSLGFKIINEQKETYYFYNEKWNCVEMLLDDC